MAVIELIDDLDGEDIVIPESTIENARAYLSETAGRDITRAEWDTLLDTVTEKALAAVALRDILGDMRK